MGLAVLQDVGCKAEELAAPMVSFLGLCMFGHCEADDGLRHVEAAGADLHGPQQIASRSHQDSDLGARESGVCVRGRFLPSDSQAGLE